ncbi:MAG: ATP-binding cassette, subfamily bacterial, partial [Thermoleophilaceae bacterium]|nr:ATP-binding cassette, subfamily bacterial [Thermoleophilaceae bacterium]
WTLRDVDVDVPAGTRTAIVGATGAGKTTLGYLVARLYEPQEGRVTIDGIDVRDMTFESLAAAVGVVSQETYLVHSSIRDNLRFARPEATDAEIEAAARAARIHDLIADLPDGYDTVVGSRGHRFSGGEKQRIAIARTLLRDPRVLILDEATSALDTETERAVQDAFDSLSVGRTTITIAHRLSTVRDADRIAVIDGGRVIAEGTGNELKERVGGQILEVELASAVSRDKAQAVLRGVGCGEPEPDERADRLTLPAPRDGLEMIEDAAAALRQAGIEVTNFGLRGPTLDDVFLQLTGVPASGDGDQPRSSTTAAPAVEAARGSLSPERRPGRRSPRLPRLHVPTPAELRSWLTDTRVVTGRNLRHFTRQPQLLVFSTIQPVMFVLLFAYVFGGAVKGSLPGGVKYIDFLLPGIFVQSVAFRATQTAVGLSEDLERGVIDRFRSMPMARSAVLIGRTVADLVRNVLIIVLMTGVAYLIGFRFQAGIPNGLACVAVVSAFGFALSWIFAFVALTVRGAEAAQSAGFVVIFPLVFASSVFVPVASMPGWLQAIAKVSPVTLTANAGRTYALDGGVPAALGGAAAWIVGLLVIFIPLCVWRYRRMN